MNKNIKQENSTWNVFFVIMVVVLFYIGFSTTYKLLICLFLIHGLFLLNVFFEKQNQIRNKYLALILKENITSIDILTVEMKKTQTKIISDIVDLIKKGYLKGRVIDLEINEIVLARDLVAHQKRTQIIDKEYEKHSKVVYKSISCPGCGAKSKVPLGEGINCQFCNTYLEG